MTGRPALRSTPGRIGATLLAILLGACAAAPAEQQGDLEVTLTVANDGTAPLRCMLIFGHWVELDAGRIAPGASLALALRRQASDGALYVPRYDGRKMMLENLICGPLLDWWPRRADIPLLPLRATAAPRFAASCHLTEGVAGRAACTSPRPAR